MQNVDNSNKGHSILESSIKLGYVYSQANTDNYSTLWTIYYC